MSEEGTGQGEEVGKGGSPAPKRGWKWWGIGVLVLVLVGLAMPAIVIKADRGLRIKEVSNVKQLILACSLYASDRDGKYPERLQDLYPYYIDIEDFFEAYNPETQMSEPYIYFPGQADSDFPRSPLVENEKRVVGFVGGLVIEMREEEFQRMMNAQESNAAGAATRQ